jgi:hypothetical protein
MPSGRNSVVGRARAFIGLVRGRPIGDTVKEAGQVCTSRVFAMKCCFLRAARGWWAGQPGCATHPTFRAYPFCASTRMTHGPNGLRQLVSRGSICSAGRCSTGQALPSMPRSTAKEWHWPERRLPWVVCCRGGWPLLQACDMGQPAGKGLPTGSRAARPQRGVRPGVDPNQTPGAVWSAIEWLADRQDSNGMIRSSA